MFELLQKVHNIFFALRVDHLLQFLSVLIQIFYDLYSFYGKKVVIVVKSVIYFTIFQFQLNLKTVVL